MRRPAAATNTGRAPPPSAAAAAAEAVQRAAADGAMPAKRKRRMRPIGMSLVEWVSPGYLVGLALLLYAFGQFLSHPLDDLRGTEQRIDVMRVIDGDTFYGKVQPQGYAARFRLKRIDAPEIDQPFGNDARVALERLLIGDLASLREAQHTADLASEAAGAISDTEVVALIDAQDDWGRYVVDVVVRKGLSTRTSYVQKALVESGHAWTLSTFNRQGQLKVAMDEAKDAKRGLWSSDKEPVEPWKHRWSKRRGPDVQPGSKGPDPRAAGGRTHHKYGAAGAARGGKFQGGAGRGGPGGGRR